MNTIYEVAFREETANQANKHLLQHFQKNQLQEELCFALWRPGTGKSRYTGIVYKIILPEKGDRTLHGNVEFAPQFLSRALNQAIQEKAGLAFMHSHPTDGWQDMSLPDVIAERDVLFSPSMATGLPLLGLTIGTDAYWSARFWKKQEGKIKRSWCQKVRIVGSKSYKIYCNNHLLPAPERKIFLKRTFDTWGTEHQNNLARLKVGIVGLGSVGCIIAESLARLGVNNIVLIDPDKVEAHNLDRLLYGTKKHIGCHKVDVAKQLIEEHTVAHKVNIEALPYSIHDEKAYLTALDCDFLFSCVDRPMARDVLNFISFSHLIPVVDGGIKVALNKEGDFYSSHWRSHLVTPYHQCLRCNKQYTTSDVIMELDGSLDNPSYVKNLPKHLRIGNQNVFPFSLSIAGMELNQMIRYIISNDWWPEMQQQDYQFLTGLIKVNNQKCETHCVFQKERIAKGDKCKPHYIVCTNKEVSKKEKKKSKNSIFISFKNRAKKFIAKLFDKEFLK